METFKPGNIYRLQYLIARGHTRFGQLRYVGQEGTDTHRFRGKPTIGDIVMLGEEILWSEALPAGFVAWTCFNKRTPPWPS